MFENIITVWLNANGLSVNDVECYQKGNQIPLEILDPSLPIVFKNKKNGEMQLYSPHRIDYFAECKIKIS